MGHGGSLVAVWVSTEPRQRRFAATRQSPCDSTTTRSPGRRAEAWTMELYRQFVRSSGCVPELAAHAHVAAGGAVIAAVPADERAVAALGARRAGEHRCRRLVRGRFEDAHLPARDTFLVEDAEHGVAVHDEPRQIRDGRRIGLLLAAAGDEGHEVAERLGEIEELAQLHADPCRIE